MVLTDCNKLLIIVLLFIIFFLLNTTQRNFIIVALGSYIVLNYLNVDKKEGGFGFRSTPKTVEYYLNKKKSQIIPSPNLNIEQRLKFYKEKRERSMYDSEHSSSSEERKASYQITGILNDKINRLENQKKLEKIL